MNRNMLRGEGPRRRSAARDSRLFRRMAEKAFTARGAGGLKRDEVSSARHHFLDYLWSMILTFWPIVGA